MSNNIDYLKESLLKTFQLVPNDFALSEVKNLMRLAIIKLEEVEKKREKRSVNSQTKKEQFVSMNPKQSLKALENAISDEKEKLKNLSEKRNKKVDDQDEMQSLFD